MTRTIAFRPRDKEQRNFIDKYMEENGLNQTQAMRKLVSIALKKLDGGAVIA